jgi:hypothetical protein
MAPMPPALLFAWAAAGFVLGWGVRVGFDWWGRMPPTVDWLQPVTLFILAAILGWAAWTTHRAVQVRRAPLPPHQMVVRLLLARASALVAALVGGGYLGYGASWFGDAAHLAEERMWRSFVAATACAVAVIAAMLLERACRTPTEDPQA